MAATITSATPSGTTLNVAGTGAVPNKKVGVFVDGVFRGPFATADGSGNWDVSIPNAITQQTTTVTAADFIDLGASLLVNHFAASVTVGLPVGTATSDVRPALTGTIVNADGVPVAGKTVRVSRRVAGSPTLVLDGSAVTDANGQYFYQVKTALLDAQYEVQAIGVAIDVPSAITTFTVSKPDEAPVMPDAQARVQRLNFDSVLVPINPPAGYVVFTASPLNIAKPLGSFSLSGESLGLAIDANTGTCTVVDPTQFGAAGDRSVTVTGTNDAGASLTSLTVKTVAAVASIRYVDSINGNDANDGSTPALADAQVTSGSTTRRYRRKGEYPALTLTDNVVREDYGDPFGVQPIVGKGVAVGVLGPSSDNWILRSIAMSDTTSRAMEIKVFSNALVEGCLAFDSRDGINGANAQAYKFHNSDKTAALSVPDLPGWFFNLIFRYNETRNYRGDGLYVTKVTGLLIENNKMDAAYGGGADCIQIAYEGQDTNITRNAVIRGNILLQKVESQTDKGALVTEKTINYLIEYNDIGGKNFSYSCIGSDGVVRSNVMRDARLTDKYSFGLGVGEQHHIYRQHIYDDLFRNCRHGIHLTSFADTTIESNGIFGFQRVDMEMHDLVFENCTKAFRADRPWSGYLRRCILIGVTTPTELAGNSSVHGNKVANLGVYTTQEMSDLRTNDGSFRCPTPPTISGTVAAGLTLNVSGGVWTENGVPVTPDEVQHFWRNKGHDIAAATSTSFAVPLDVAADFEVSCIVYARKGTNWMSAVAETPWPVDGYFIPRSWQEGAISWQKRYFKLGDVAA